MKEGWFDDDYWILCEDEAEAEQLTASYQIADYLPGYIAIGLKGWDDFILVDGQSQYYLVPTVPLERVSVAPFRFPSGKLGLEPDEKFAKKIKWYVKPIKFGGDPIANENIVWLPPEKHVEVVTWWNSRYFEAAKGRNESGGTA